MLLHLPDEVGAIRGVAVEVDVSCEEWGVGGKQKGTASKIESAVLGVAFIN